MKQLLTKYQFFMKLPQVHIFTKILIVKVKLEIYRPAAFILSYISYGGDVRGIYLFIFASCEPLSRNHAFKTGMLTLLTETHIMFVISLHFEQN